jgi:hypothetical protein
MDRLVRARILLAEAAALGVTIEDLIAESSGSPTGVSIAPTVAEYVETVRASFSKGTADTYKSYWRLAVARLGDRPIDSIAVDDCEAVVVDAVDRARRNRPGTDGRSARENCIGALRALFARAERAGLVVKTRPPIWRSRAAFPTDVGPSKTTSCARSLTLCAPPVTTRTSTC